MDLQHSSHLQQKEAKRPQLEFIGDLLVPGFKQYHLMQDSHFGKQALNCGIKRDKIDKILHRICCSSFPRNIQTIVIICGTNNLERDNLDGLDDSALYWK